VVPSSWLSVLAFALLIAPGLAFDYLREGRRAAYVESAFRETSRLVAASIGFSAVALCLLAIIRAAFPSWIPDPRLLLSEWPGYAVGHYRLILRTCLIQVAFEAGLVLLFNGWLAGNTASQIKRQSAWMILLRQRPNLNAIVRVRLKDGDSWEGTVTDFTPDLALDGRELTLGRPLRYRPKPGSPFMPVDEDWRRVVLSGSDISTLVVRYTLEGVAPAAPKRSTRRAIATALNRFAQTIDSSPAP
jgi:hypothetical protein